MDEALWGEVDRYFEEHVAGDDSVLEAALHRASAAGLPNIHVSPLQGRQLTVFALMLGATRVLEIGTLAGYSTICLARGVRPGGRVVSLEIDPKHAQVARENITAAGLAAQVDVVVGPAIATLEGLVAGRGEPFDLVFIDADKASIPVYFEQSLRVCRPGALVVIDNVVRHGEVINAASEDPSVLGVRRLHDALAADRRVICTTIQTVGVKGYDGFTLAVVKGGGAAGPG